MLVDKKVTFFLRGKFDRRILPKKNTDLKNLQKNDTQKIKDPTFLATSSSFLPVYLFVCLEKGRQTYAIRPPKKGPEILPSEAIFIPSVFVWQFPPPKSVEWLQICPLPGDSSRDLFGMVKTWPFQGVKWSPTFWGWKGHGLNHLVYIFQPLVPMDGTYGSKATRWYLSLDLNIDETKVLRLDSGPDLQPWSIRKKLIQSQKRTVRPLKIGHPIPYHPSSWSIYLHEWLFLKVNVVKYTIHGWYGKEN